MIRAPLLGVWMVVNWWISRFLVVLGTENESEQGFRSIHFDDNTSDPQRQSWTVDSLFLYLRWDAERGS